MLLEHVQQQFMRLGHESFIVDSSRLITTIFPRIYARTYYAHPRARVMSFSPALAAFKSHVELLPRVAAYLKSDRRGYYEGNSMM